MTSASTTSILKPANFTFWAQNQTFYNQYAPWYAPHFEVFRNSSCFTGTADIVIPATKFVLPYDYTYIEQSGSFLDAAAIPTINAYDSVWFVNPFNQSACLWRKGQQQKELTCIGGSGCIEGTTKSFGQAYDHALIIGTPDVSQASTVVQNSASSTAAKIPFVKFVCFLVTVALLVM
jgi:hypothetical protein